MGRTSRTKEAIGERRKKAIASAEEEKKKMEDSAAQLARARQLGGWIRFDDPVEDAYERFRDSRADHHMDLSGSEPGAAFWAAEPDHDLPLENSYPWEKR